VRYLPLGGREERAKRRFDFFRKGKTAFEVKKYPARFSLSKKVADAVGEKGQTGRRPLRREKAKPLGAKNPRVPERSDRKVGSDEGRKGIRERKKKSLGRLSGGRRPIGRNAQESNLVPTRPNPSGGNKGHGFSGESKPLKRRYEAFYGFVRKRQSGKKASKEVFDLWRGAKL
jgi:hypothetical protein